MIFKEDTLAHFENITGYSINSFFYEFIEFVQKLKPHIINYYSGIEKSPYILSFTKLDFLLDEIVKVKTLISLNKDSFSDFGDWVLLEKIEDIHLELLTVSNSSKFLRSSITKNNFNPNPELNYVLSQGDTLEKVSRSVLGSQDFQNDWISIQLRNDLKEEDYTVEGGNLLKISFNNSVRNFTLQAVVDNLQGEKVLGLDLNRKITFVDTDLEVLSYRETARQSILIYSSLRRGDNPEFPLDGLSLGLVVGTNMGSLGFPSIFRQLYSIFVKDDTFKSFSISDINHKDDSIMIDFSVETRLGDITPGTLMI